MQALILTLAEIILENSFNLKKINVLRLSAVKCFTVFSCVSNDQKSMLTITSKIQSPSLLLFCLKERKPIFNHNKCKT